MRYNQAVFLRIITAGAYNSETGNYDAETVSETKVYANVHEHTEEIHRLEYGTIAEKQITVTFQRPHYGWNNLRYSGKIYEPVTTTCDRTVTLKEKP